MTSGKIMTIFDMINKGAEVLSKSLTDVNYRFESELLLSFVLNKERIYLIVHQDETINDKSADLFLSYIERRAKGEPFSYITGSKEFMSLDFTVRSGVLIPRPDTEALVCHVIDNFRDKNPLILDLCTGSGAIAVSCAKYIEGAFVTAVDISDVCIKTAKENAEKHGVANKVTVICADVLTDFETSKKFDCIVSNPPYIKTDVLPTLMKDVRDFEPSLALDGGDDGLIFYRKISALAPLFLNENGILAFEVGHDQAEDVKKIMHSEGFNDIEFIKDLAGINRVVSGKIRGC